MLTLAAGVALADNPAPGKTSAAPTAPAAPATVPAPAKTAPTTTPEPVAKAPAGGTTRETLLADLKKANTQLADDKQAAAEAGKGKDKDAAKAAKDKVKADGKAINEINMKLHALKAAKPAPAKPTPAK